MSIFEILATLDAKQKVKNWHKNLTNAEQREYGDQQLYKAIYK